MDNTSTQKPGEYTSGMSGTAEGIKDKASTTAEGIKSKAQEYGSKAQEYGSAAMSKAQEYGSTAMNKAKDATTTVAGQMGSLAGMIRENAPREGSVGSAATAVADSLESAGSYLQDKGFENMVTDLTGLVRRYPMQSLLVGVGIGYLLARRGTEWR
ncbi:MAG: hypothetical protein ACRERD_31985 [Candidatus Binatia bacterium]